MVHPYIEWAYNAIKHKLHLDSEFASNLAFSAQSPKKNSSKEQAAEGVFVTLYSKNKREKKELRGCIGRHRRIFDNLEEEISHCALQSAFEDPRFSPLTAEEIKDLEIEISLLGKPEAITNHTDLDPKKWGVIAQKGIRQATLLPDIEGVDTVEQQLDIVFRKAHIRPDENPVLYRFAVQKITEDSK